MGPLAEVASKKAISAVVSEAIDEVSGSSNRKWAVMLVAFLLGAVVAGLIAQRRVQLRSVESQSEPDA